MRVQGRAYFVGFRTILPPTGGSRDVGFLGCGMDALVTEVNHAIACLSDLAELSSFHMAGGIYVLDG